MAKRKKWTRKPLPSTALPVVTEEGVETYLTLAKGRYPAFLGYNYADDSYAIVLSYTTETGAEEAVKIDLTDEQAQNVLEQFPRRVVSLPAGCDLVLPIAPTITDDEGVEESTETTEDPDDEEPEDSDDE